MTAAAFLVVVWLATSITVAPLVGAFLRAGSGGED
jgi:hypothetical protein